MSDDRLVSARRIARQAVVSGSARTLVVGGKGMPSPIAENLEEAEEYRFGFDRGYTDGLRSAKAEVDTAAAQARMQWEAEARTALDAALAETQAARGAYLDSANALSITVSEDRHWAESFAIELAYAAVLRLLGEKAADRSLIERLYAQARQAVGEGIMRLRVAPDDLADVGHQAKGIELVADETLPVGSCLLETPRGRFDAGLDVRLELLRQALLRTLRDTPRDGGRVGRND
ncbi:FliH/SctL family protein [Dyella silvatica]|uniref:FliH/SctL family protein n=1 Tax=Dyella silvatica TaxID=2992128 RepID=UPI00225987A9|nr:FliH/SctL family protein [Dyella silvatica]